MQNRHAEGRTLREIAIEMNALVLKLLVAMTGTLPQPVRLSGFTHL